MIMDSVYFASYRHPAVIDSVLAGGGMAAGLAQGDTITAIDGRTTASLTDLFAVIGGITDGGARADTVNVAYVRDGQPRTAAVALDDKGKMNILFQDGGRFTHKEVRDYSFLASLPAGVAYGVKTLKSYVSDMKYVFTEKGAKSLGGFGTIANIFPQQWDWQRFWEMTAFLSVILAFMNILPIPALDGGHVLFLLYEIITRRRPSDRFLERAQVVGMVLLLALLVFANCNDVVRIFT